MMYLESLPLVSAGTFWAYMFLGGIGLGYAWRAFFQFF